MTRTMRELCKEYTNLTEEDISLLENVAFQLPLISNLTGNDIFIDALTRNGADSIVLAWASPGSRSLYRTSVVGELAYRDSEPAVYRTFTTGDTTRDVRGVSQEGLPIAQTVVPIRNSSNKIIGVLIMERDISKELRQEEQVEFLSQTAERLSGTLMYLSMTEASFEEWLGNGIFVLNKQNKITYTNKNAAEMFKNHCGIDALGNDFSELIPACKTLTELLAYLENPVEINILNKCYCLQAYPLVTQGELSGCAVAVQDITDLRKKEQELNAKSTIIREIHHRVKNNLQNIAALLRLQMRRSESDIVKAEFAASINRIISISLVHDVFAHQTWDTIDSIELCQKILVGLIENATISDHRIVTRVEGQHVQLSSSQAVPLALVVNELVTNSLKHAVGPQKKGEIVVFIKEGEKRIYVCVTDNGPEPPDAFFQAKKNNLGLQIVNSLVREQLDGEFSLERVGGVTRAMVSFPKQGLEEEL